MSLHWATWLAGDILTWNPAAEMWFPVSYTTTEWGEAFVAKVCLHKPILNLQMLLFLEPSVTILTLPRAEVRDLSMTIS